MLEQLTDEFRRKTPEVRQQFALPLRWFAKGNNEVSSLERFIAYWIAFSSLYEDTSKREQEAVTSYIQANVDKLIAQRYVERVKELLSPLSAFQVELGRGRKKRAISQELADLLGQEAWDCVNITEVTVLTIYGIRNLLFHGALDPNSAGIAELIEIAEHLLSKLLQYLISAQILGDLLPPRRFVVHTEVGF